MSFNALKVTHLLAETCSRVIRPYNIIKSCVEGEW